MSSAKRHLFIALTFVLAAATFAVLTPRAVHAITATLVQVMNTSTNPVPTSESALRFQTALCIFSGTISTTVINSCTGNGGTSFTVPTTTSTGAAVKRVVLENVSGFCSTFSNPNLQMKAVRLRGQFAPDSDSNGVSSFTHYVPMADGFNYVNAPIAPAPYTNVQETDTTFGQTANFSFGAGETVTLEPFYFYTNDPPTVDYYCIVRAEGHVVTQ